MSRVTGVGTGGVTPAKSRNTTPAGTGTGFSVAGDEPAEAAQATPAPQSVMLSGMLALQEVEGTNIQDKAARRHGFAMLQALEKLQKELLSNLGDRETEVSSLTRLTAEMPTATDPGLSAVLDTIRVRAKIELLRRGVEIN